jgi:uncharacterized protein YggE
MSDDSDSPDVTGGARPATVRVRGEGQVEVAPDAATVTIGVLVSKASLKKAREEAAARAADAIAAVKEAGIPDRDIQTSEYVIQPRRSIDAKAKPTEIAGYDVRNTISVTVRDLERLPELLDAAVAASANQVNGPSFFIQHPEAAEDEASRLAMADARRRAEVLAEAAGATLGRVRSIDEVEEHSGPAPRMMMRAMAADSGATTPIEAGTERITARVEVVWELA